METKQIQQELRAFIDEDYRVFQSRLVPGTENILGVRVPELRKMAKQIAKEDWRPWFEEGSNQYYEEDMLRGMVLGYAKMSLEERLERIRSFVPDIKNWAVCDCVCSGLKFTEKHREVVWKFLQPYFRSEKTYDLRFASVMALNYFVTEDYAPKVFEHFDQMTNHDYYVEMGAAWAISMYYVKLPELTETYIRSNHLDDFIHNKAIQKICESYRVDNETKIRLRGLKRKK